MDFNDLRSYHHGHALKSGMCSQNIREESFGHQIAVWPGKVVLNLAGVEPAQTAFGLNTLQLL